MNNAILKNGVMKYGIAAGSVLIIGGLFWFFMNQHFLSVRESRTDRNEMSQQILEVVKENTAVLQRIDTKLDYIEFRSVGSTAPF